VFNSPYATKFTRDGERDMRNRKPYRTKGQKLKAREEAFLLKGTYVSPAGVSFHKQANAQL
jgi:hypothetical protein